MLYSGNDKDDNFFFIMEIGYGGIPGRPIGDGMDGHSGGRSSPIFQPNTSKAIVPLRVDRYSSVIDSGGGRFASGREWHRQMVHLSRTWRDRIHDDRWLTPPWGILGGKPGMRSTKFWSAPMEPEPSLPSKCDQIKVEPGDQLIFQTAGGGGWGDPLERDIEKVRVDVVRELVSVEKAAADYGVVYDPARSEVDETATQALRQSMKKSRDEPHTFDFGPPLKNSWRAVKRKPDWSRLLLLRYRPAGKQME